MVSPKNKICFASVDVEGAIDDNLNKILDILKKYGISATLFVVGEVLAKAPDLFKDLGKTYEIACHSFTHRFWNTLDREARKKELDDFTNLYQKIFNKKPLGFRAPSHVIDAGGLKLLEEKGFLYDSSIVPHYPPFKKYRGYQGRKPQNIYFISGLMESPVTGQIFGIPLAAAWLAKLPFRLYKILFSISCPEFITLSWHSWNNPKNLEKIIKLLKNKNYQFLNGEQIYQNYRQK